MPSSGAPRTFHVYKSGNNTEPITRALLRRGWESVDDEARLGESWTANFVWKPTWSKAKPAPAMFARQHANGNRRQVYNHLRAIEPLCQKDSVFETMRSYYTALREDPFQHIPPTFLIEPKLGGNADAWPGWPEFAEHFARCAADASLKNLWLVKPTSANRGIGIEVFSSFAQIQAFLESKARGAAIGIRPIWVLQKYIENPVLFHGRKFDLRVWVVVLDNGDVFMHAPGYVRTSSETFDLDSENRYAHLTNYCQQVLNKESFGKFEEGNTLTFADLEDYMGGLLLASKGSADGKAAAAVTTAPSPAATAAPRAGAEGAKRSSKPVSEARSGVELMWGCGASGLWGQMRAAVVDAFSALQGRGGSRSCGYEENGFARRPPAHVALPSKGGVPAAADPAARKAGEPGSRHRFELLGLDFMVDLNSKIHFIEVNTNPSLSYQNATWHEGFVDEMCDSLLDLVMADAWPEALDAAPEPLPDAEPACDVLKRPKQGWQFVMNVYLKASVTPPSQQLASDAIRARGGGKLCAEDAREGKEKLLASIGSLGFGTSAPSTRASGSAVNRTVSLAASRLLAKAAAASKKAAPAVAATLPKAASAGTEAEPVGSGERLIPAAAAAAWEGAECKEPEDSGGSRNRSCEHCSGADLLEVDGDEDDACDESEGGTLRRLPLEASGLDECGGGSGALLDGAVLRGRCAVAGGPALRSASLPRSLRPRSRSRAASSVSPSHEATDDRDGGRQARFARPPLGLGSFAKGVPANRVPAVFRPIVLEEGGLGLTLGAMPPPSGGSRSSSVQHDRGTIGGGSGGAPGRQPSPKFVVSGVGALDISAIDVGPGAEVLEVAGPAPPRSPLRVNK